MAADPMIVHLPATRDEGNATPGRKPYEPPRLVVLSADATAGKPQHSPVESISNYSGHS